MADDLLLADLGLELSEIEDLEGDRWLSICEAYNRGAHRGACSAEHRGLGPQSEVANG
jgi:hypothetical protein